MNRLNKIGPQCEPYRTPEGTLIADDMKFPILTHSIHPETKPCSYFNIWPPKPKKLDLAIRNWWFTLSTTFKKSVCMLSTWHYIVSQKPPPENSSNTKCWPSRRETIILLAYNFSSWPAICTEINFYNNLGCIDTPLWFKISSFPQNCKLVHIFNIYALGPQ